MLAALSLLLETPAKLTGPPAPVGVHRLGILHLAFVRQELELVLYDAKQRMASVQIRLQMLVWVEFIHGELVGTAVRFVLVPTVPERQVQRVLLMELRFVDPATRATTCLAERVRWNNDVHVQMETQSLVRSVKSTTRTVIMLSITVLRVTPTTTGGVVHVRCVPRVPPAPMRVLLAAPVKIERVPRTLVPVRTVMLQQEQVVLQMVHNVRRVLEAII